VLVWAVVLLVAVLTVLAVRVVWAERRAAPTPVTHTDAAGVTAGGLEGTSPPPGAAPGAGPATSSAASATTGPLYVHVIGAVRRAGVVRVAPGARVEDVVAAAGGMSGAAEPRRLNLARPVVDGERIWVPVRGAQPPAEEVPQARAEESSTHPAAPTGGGTSPVDLNTADSTALQSLPGVGPVTAEAILTWRAEHGRFSTVEELVEVSGIGPRTMDRLRPQVTVTP
jgi:competence protein ComEA